MQFKDNNPIFMQIAEYICDEILNGQHPEGDRLPSVREYAAEAEVNVNTVVRSYDWLSQNEIIFNRRGMGYFVCEGAADNIRRTRRETFFRETLPELFRQMDALGIGISEIETEYNNN